MSQVQTQEFGVADGSQRVVDLVCVDMADPSVTKEIGMALHQANGSTMSIGTEEDLSRTLAQDSSTSGIDDRQLLLGKNDDIGGVQPMELMIPEVLQCFFMVGRTGHDPPGDGGPDLFLPSQQGFCEKLKQGHRSQG